MLDISEIIPVQGIYNINIWVNEFGTVGPLFYGQIV